MNVFDSLKTKQAAVVTETTAAWDAAVVQFAADPTTATEKAVTAMLKLTGKSVDELQVAVARQTRINSLRAEIAEYPIALATQQQTATKFAEFRDEKAAMQKKLDAELSRVRGENNAAGWRVVQINEAASELRRLTGESVILPTVAEADAVITPATNELEFPHAAASEIRLPSDM